MEDKNSQNLKIIIYGAGAVGRQVMSQYYSYIDELELLCFAVSDMTENQKHVLGIPVFKIDDLVQYKNEALVMISVSEKYQQEVTEHVTELGFKNVQYYTEQSKNYKLIDKLIGNDYKKTLTTWYFWVTGEELNWNNLKTYNEKIQWLKLYDQLEKKKYLADKYAVRDFIRDKIGEKYLIPILGCWDKAEEINYTNLPKEFVLKCNHGSGWNIVVNDKTQLDYDNVTKQLNSWINSNYAYISGFEMHYKNIKPKIIAEQMLHTEDGEDLKDYKVFVFNGRAKIIQVDIDRCSNHRRNLYTRNWEYISEGICYPMAPDIKIEKPDCLDELIELSEVLGEGFRHVRVDFYIVDHQIYFGEMTFTHGSGTEKFTSEEFALKMGSWIELPYGEGY